MLAIDTRIPGRWSAWLINDRLKPEELNFPGDDFAFDASGSLYVATHVAQTVVRIDAAGNRAAVAGPKEGAIGRNKFDNEMSTFWYQPPRGNDASPTSEFSTHITMRGGPDPAFRRIYHTDKGADIVRSRPMAVNQVEEFRSSGTLEEFAEIFDGSEKLVSIVVEPWYLRQVLMPTDGA
jgi:hypothetical protein